MWVIKLEQPAGLQYLDHRRRRLGVLDIGIGALGILVYETVLRCSPRRVRPRRILDAVRFRLGRDASLACSLGKARTGRASRGVPGQVGKLVHGSRAFDSLPLVSDTAELGDILKKNRAAFRSGVASAGRI